MINMRGSEPVFKSLTFDGDSEATHGLLVYENNEGGLWGQSEVLSFNEGKFCIINQLEIFRLVDVTGAKSFKFYMERLTRGSDTKFTRSWTQKYNPYDDGSNNNISASSGATITGMSFNSSTNGWLKTNNSDIILMPKNTTGVTAENKYITKIYVKTEDYYQAWL